MFKIRSVKATKPTVPPPEPFFKTTAGIITIVAGCVAVILAIVAVVIWRKRAKRRLVKNAIFIGRFDARFFCNVIVIE